MATPAPPACAQGVRRPSRPTETVAVESVTVGWASPTEEPFPRRSKAGPATALPAAALALAATIWGVTFTVADEAAAVLPSTDLVAWRFGLGTVALAALGRSRPRLPNRLRRRGVILGALLGGGFLLQTWGLTYTDALTSGFLTSMLVVFAPLVGWLLFGKRLNRWTWCGVALALTGIMVLSLHGARLGPGEVITLASAALWGLHVVLLSRWSSAGHTLRLAGTQTATVAVMALLAMTIRAVTAGRVPLPTPPPDAQAWVSVGFLALLGTAAAMALLSWAQSRVDATRAAVILTLEPAVAGLTAVAAGTPLTVRTLVGAVLLLAAMSVVELAGRRGSTPAMAVTGSPTSWSCQCCKRAARWQGQS